MAKQTKAEGTVFAGSLFLGIAAGLVVSTLTDNWIYTGAFTLAGMGLGLILTGVAKTK